VTVGLAVWGVRAYRAGLSGEPLPNGAASGEYLAPADLPALGYLPDGSNVVVGVHVRPILDSPDGRQTLAALGLDPAATGGLGLERMTGVPLDNLDHVAAGVQLEGGTFSVTVVAQTRRPYDGDRVRQALQAGRPVKHGDRTLYPVQVPLPGIPAGSGLLWCATDHTLVLGLGIPAKDFDVIPDRPKTDVERFRGPLPKLIRDRLEKGTVVWAAFHAERWDNLIIKLALGQLPEELQFGERMRSAAVGLRLDAPAHLRLIALCSTPAGAGRLEGFLEQTAERAKVDSLRQERDENELTAELPADAATVRQFVGSMKKN
jgi:hypothetical protein